MQHKVKFISLQKTPLLSNKDGDGEVFTFPSEEQLKDVTERVQIQTLRLWGSTSDYLRQIQIVLTNGLTSPVYTACDKGDLTEFEFKPEVALKQVRVRSDTNLTHIEFKDKEEKVVHQKAF